MGATTTTTTETPATTSSTTTAVPLLSFRLRGRTGEEQVAVRVDDNVATHKLTKSWQTFSFDVPADGIYYVDFTNDGGTRDVYFENVFPRRSAVSHPGNWPRWNCGSESENIRCGKVRSGTFAWGGRYSVQPLAAGPGHCLCGQDTFVGTNTPRGWASCQTIYDKDNICGRPESSQEHARKYCCVKVSTTTTTTTTMTTTTTTTTTTTQITTTTTTTTTTATTTTTTEAPTTMEIECVGCDECDWNAADSQGRRSFGGRSQTANDCKLECLNVPSCVYAAYSHTGYCHLFETCTPRSGTAWTRWRKSVHGGSDRRLAGGDILMV